MKTYDIKEFEVLQPNLERLNAKKILLDNKRPLPYSILTKVKEQLSLEWTYNSNSIEGNTLNEHETQMVLLEGSTVKGKSLREHFEVYNHDKALKFLYQIAKPDYLLDTKDILSIHELMLRSVEDDYAGRLRTGAVRIVGANFIPPAAHKVSEMLDDLVDYVNQNPDYLDDVLLSTIFHHRFVYIHPFSDGNGRTVRLIMNLLLIRKGYPPAIILKADRKKYYEALNLANNGKYQKLALMMIQAVDRSLTIYLNSFDMEKNDDYQPISSFVNEPEIPYSQEYISLLSRRGKIDAYKEGKDWFTSKNAILKYMKR